MLRADGRRTPIYHRLLSAQHPLRAGLGADGRRRPEAVEAAEKLAASMLGAIPRRWRGWCSRSSMHRISPTPSSAVRQRFLELTDPGRTGPVREGSWHYARALAHIRSGDLRLPPMRACAAALENDRRL